MCRPKVWSLKVEWLLNNQILKPRFSVRAKVLTFYCEKVITKKVSTCKFKVRMLCILHRFVLIHKN